MEAVVRESGLDWTIVRPSGLFDLTELTSYVAGEFDPVGAFTARVDLADYLVKLAQDGTTRSRTVVISTTQHIPTMWEMVRREAFKSDATAAPSA
ncbi:MULTISPECIES: NAD(P)H-binding protein [unclassified Mycobacterium]|uniref:NAD(P)H-binding protein n=1 Tax=unclassified Mycobacterium TaxID=2642494 RepID=UPI000AADA9C1|nr:MULTISPECIES: NAD(P)H-binding protein [unclassified Mycobacterium]